MNKRFIGFIALIAMLIAGFGCSQNSSLDSIEKTKVENLEAFAKLYGYVRYFHPSDEAASINWDKFLFYGIEQVSAVNEPAGLKKVLENLFLPIAPTIDIYLSKDEPKPRTVSNKTNNQVLVTWQHLGQGSEYDPYTSIRLGRTDIGDSVNFIYKEWPIGDYYGNNKFELFLNGEVGKNTRAKVRIVTFKADYSHKVFSQVIEADALNKTILSGTFPEGTIYIALDLALNGEGSLKVEDLKFSMSHDDNKNETLYDSRNEWRAEEKGNSPKGWNIKGFGYDYEIGKHNDLSYLHIKSKKGVIPGALFDKYAEANEVITKNLGGGIYCKIPLALYLPREKPTQFSSAFNDLNSSIETVQLENNTAQLEPTRVGALITSWSIFNHFYPYFHVIDTDWDDVLTKTLGKVLRTRNEEECLTALSEMVSQLEDGHAFVSHPINRKLRSLPVLFDYVENQIVVLQSNDTSLKTGDILKEIDGELASDVFNRFRKLSSGSPQTKERKALYRITRQDSTSISKLKINRSGEILEVVVARKGQIPKPLRPDKISMIKEGVFYINLDKASMAEINQRIHEIAESEGVIFDLRGYPNANHGIINHLIDTPVKSPRYHTPLIIFPDLENIVGFDTTGRSTYYPTAPRMKGRIVFLTNATAISYAESVMGVIEHYELADIVGSPTAGANGDINIFGTMGGFRITWTGLETLKQDYSQHHLIGIQPTVFIKPTLKGIQEGRDEVLEKAIEIISK